MRANFKNDEEYIQKIERLKSEYIPQIKGMLPVTLSEFKEFNIFLDHWPLGLYLNYYKIGYNFIEDGCGMLSKPEKGLDMVRKTDVGLYYLAKDLGLFGLNDNVKLKYADLDNQPSDFHDAKAVDFSAKKILKQLDKNDIRNLLRIFDVPNMPLSDKKKALFLTQNYINLNLMSISEQKQLFGLLLDYFAEDYEIYIKPHPFDYHPNYSEWYPDVRVIPRSAPSELLPYCSEVNFEVGLTACSTGIHNLTDILDQVVSFTPQIEVTYKFIHRYYTVVRIIKQFGPKFSNIVGVGVDDRLLNQLYYQIIGCEASGIIITEVISSDVLTGSNLIIVDDMIPMESDLLGQTDRLLSSLGDNDVVLFLNTSDKYVFYTPGNEQIFDFISNIVISSVTIADGVVGNLCEEEIYVYSMDEKTRKEIASISFEKQLNKLRQKVFVNQYTSSAYVNQKFYEGIIRAMTRRLNEQIAIEKELKEEIKMLASK